MKPRLHPTPTVFVLAVIIAINVICFPTIWSQQPSPYNACGQPLRCGSEEFEYPFWGEDRPAYCGHPGFQLTCSSDVPLLNYQSVEYRVLDISSSTETITVARNDLQSTLCPPSLHDTTYNHTLFNSNNFDQYNVSLYYGCQTTIPVPVGPNYRFTCDGTDSYFYRTDRILTDLANSLVECRDSITVPVNRSSADRIQGITGSASESDLRSALIAGFNLLWTVYDNECDQCVRSSGECGSNSTSPELFACYCASGTFSLTCNNEDQSGGSKGSNTRNKLIVGFLSGVLGIALMISVFLLWLKKNSQHGMPHHFQGTTRNHHIEIFIRNYGPLALTRFNYSEIKKMTSSFLEKLGQGGYGSVYKGQLPDGKLVAVKLLSEATGDGEDFINEVASISRTSHVNVVTLLGFCIEGKKRALLYEFMPNGSLDKFLCVDDTRLDWNTLFLIAKGIARGLEYLHQGCNTRIVHFDIKPHNILLDEDFIPKVSDFGLAKLCKKKQSIVSVMGARGTAGYMAPEVFFRTFGGASHKSDVYSYGMMVLEMTGARKNINSSLTSASEAYFPDWVYKQVETGDNLGVQGLTNEVEGELARKMVVVSLWCIQSDPSDRPSISKVVEMLEGSFESLQVPPNRFWSSPARPDHETFPLVTQSSTSEGILISQGVGEHFSS